MYTNILYESEESDDDLTTEKFYDFRPLLDCSQLTDKTFQREFRLIFEIVKN
jgi:hypothetical protein